ncbi:MAG: glycosyltransferase family 4 protein, partial [bacterium]
MKKFLKIVHFIYDHPQNPWLGGGGAYRAMTINIILANRGHHITMICGKFPGKKPIENQNGICICYVGKSRNYLLSRLSYAFCARKILNKDKFDIIVDDTSAFSISMPYLKSDLPRLAIVHHLFGIHAVRKHPILGIGPFLFEKLNIRAYNKVIVGSPSVQRQIKNILGSMCNVSFIPYGVDEFLFQGQSVEKNYILFLGRYDIYNKGIDILLEAYKSFKDKNPNIKLIFTGGGRDNDKLKKMITEHVFNNDIELRGRVTGLEKRKVIEECMFLCMPSRYEGWG